MAGVEQHGHGNRAVFGHIDLGNVADLAIIRHGADGALYRIENLEPRPCPMRQKRAVPTPGPDRGRIG